MRNIKLFESVDHRFILLNESEPGEEDGVRSNQSLITHHNDGVLLAIRSVLKVLGEMLRYVGPEQIKAIFLSHQDPDIVGGLTT